MRILIATIFSALLLINTPLLAGPGHDHDHGHSHGPISKSKAIAKADRKLRQLATAGRIEKSWSGLSVHGITKKNFGKGDEWVVTYINKSVKEPSKQTLYIFYTIDGRYLASNFSGK